MNVRTLLLCLVLASPVASANTYGYPKEKRPSVSLREAGAIAERIIAQHGLKGYYALDANLLGDEKQTGSGGWNLHYCNSKGKEILIGVCFPEDMVVYQGPTKDQKFAELVYTRDGKISKKWLDQKAKMEKEGKQSNLDRVSPVDRVSPG